MKYEFILKDGGYYYITEEQLTVWGALYRQIDVYAEVEKMALESYHNVLMRKTSKSINKFINKKLKELNERGE